MTGTKVSLTVEAGTAWITLDGPERRNALDAQAARDLAAITGTVRSMVAHLAADPALARALAADLHRTVHDPGAWDRAVEIERARQMWSLARNPKES
jgi:hypothetical protein